MLLVSIKGKGVFAKIKKFHFIFLVFIGATEPLDIKFKNIRFLSCSL